MRIAATPCCIRRKVLKYQSNLREAHALGRKGCCGFLPQKGKNGPSKPSAGCVRPVCVALRDMFGRCLRGEGMVELVVREVAGAASKAPALAFLAAVARDHGAVPQALRLFRQVNEHAHNMFNQKNLWSVSELGLQLCRPAAVLSSGSMSIYAFLAAVTCDHGAVPQALLLFR